MLGESRLGECLRDAASHCCPILAISLLSVWAAAVPLVLYLGMKSGNPKPQFKDLFRAI